MTLGDAKVGTTVVVTKIEGDSPSILKSPLNNASLLSPLYPDIEDLFQVSKKVRPAVQDPTLHSRNHI